MPRKALTEKFITSLKPAAPGKRDWYQDALQPSFGVRVTDKGAKSFSVYRRWPPLNMPAHRKVGTVDDISLKEARKLAGNLISLADDGIDPREDERRAEEVIAHTFGAVAEAWLTKFVLKHDRRHLDVRADVYRAFIPIWGHRPIADISEDQIKEFFKEKGEAHPAMARNLLIHIKRMYKWAIAQEGRSGITDDPTALLSPLFLIGRKSPPRDRIFTDEELRLVWHAAGAMPHPYPFGEMLQALVLTGCRLREVAHARRREVDLSKRLWTIPAGRMKMKATHVVPICDDLFALLSRLPRFNRGDYLFSTSSGEKPVSGFAKAKERIDVLVGDIPHWTFHDTRRSMRNRISDLKIKEHIRERMMAHAQPVLTQTYVPDPLAYIDAKRDGFELWEAELRKIVESK